MGKLMVRQIPNLLQFDISQLEAESKEEGFHFVGRLMEDFHNGNNTFNKPGEALFGVFSEQNEIVGIGGINQDPFSNQTRVGRLRRFYIAKNYRRMGVGSVLLNSILQFAIGNFDDVVLHTDTPEADKFYTSFGFLREYSYPNATHRIHLV